MASMSLPNQSFFYDELPENSIRLLDLVKQENDQDAIALHMRTYRLDDVPSFNALSYVWGQSSEVYKLLCLSEQGSRAGEMTVPTNLFKALPFIKAASSRPIWIDAVCIDQGNDDEKAKIIPILGEYYTKAADVMIWLGPRSNGSDLAMDVLNWIWFPPQRDPLQSRLCGPSGWLEPSHLASLLSSISNRVHITNTVSDTERLGVPSVGHPLWAALRGLYLREWFFRVWTVQEIMLATNATVLCGDRALPWTAFKQLGDALSETQLLWVGQPSGPSVASPLRNLDPYRDGERFWLYLRGARVRLCKYKEDRIFGLLALAAPRIRAKIKVAYDREDPDHYIQVYRAATITCLEEFPLVLILTEATSSAKAAKLPSWCPDWSAKATSYVTSATFTSDATFWALRSYSVDPLDHNILRVRGQHIDVVEEVIDDHSHYWPDGVSGVDGPADKILQWLNRCEALTRRTIASDEAATDAYWKTLLSYSDTHNSSIFPPDPVGGFAAYRKRLAECRDSIPLAGSALSSQDLQALGPLLRYVGFLWPGKVFFSTKEGRIGLANKGISAQDQICLFFGANSHFVLKPLDNVTHCLKAVAYVHGMMGDVAAALRLRGGDIPGPRMFRIR